MRTVRECVSKDIISRIFLDPSSDRFTKVNPYLTEMLSSRGEQDPRIVFGQELIGLKGRWADKFNAQSERGFRPEKIIVEIGMHKGHVLADMAAHVPEVGFVGLDITFKRVVLSSKRIAARGLRNAFCVYGDARYLYDVFEPSEIDGVVVFFPDPWSKKKKQRRNRLIDENFCVDLIKLIKPGGFVWLKTDDSEYFAEGAKHLEAAGFAPSSDSVSPWLGTYCSLFERRFKEQKVATFEGVWMKSFPAFMPC